MSKADEPPGGDPEEARKQAEAILRQRALGRELRSIYNQYVDEPVPSTFDDLLDRLERGDEKSSGAGDGQGPNDGQGPQDDRAGRSGR